MTEYMGYLERGQMPPQHLHSDLVQLKVDLIYQKIKYPCIGKRWIGLCDVYCCTISLNARVDDVSQ